MKKFSKILVFLVLAVFLMAGSASADLIGIEGYTPSYPDIKFNDIGRLRYDKTSQIFDIYNSVDEMITMPNSLIYPMSNTWDYSIVTGFGLAIQVDNSGNLMGGVDNTHTFSWDLLNSKGSYSGSYVSDEGYDMVEVLMKGTIVIEGHTYTATTGNPVLLLAAEVVAFGWDNSVTVDFLFGDVSGALVDDGIWPGAPTRTGAVAKSLDSAGAVDWGNGFNIENKGGDKIPVPEPATMLLLGTGLLGLAGLGRKKFFKKG